MSAHPRRRIHFILFLLSILVMVATLWLPRWASNVADLKTAEAGAPVPFVVQDLTTYDRELPRTYTFESPWENPTEVLWVPLLLSLTAIFLLLELLALFFLRQRSMDRSRSRTAQT
jgi:hypothetical protein